MQRLDLPEEGVPIMSDIWRTIAASFLAVLLLLSVLSVSAAHSDTSDYFKITVIDAETGRGVPLVELKTTNKVRYYTDSNGIVAFFEPDLMDREVFFYIKSHGYEFTNRSDEDDGATLKVTRGGSVVLKIKRLNIAERLYRVTGEGIYRDSVLVGHPVPIKEPLLNGQVMGQDSVVVTPYKGRLFWTWGDTFGPAHFNGNSSGATSELPGKGGLDPSVGVDLKYFVNESGFSKGMCPLPDPGLVWIFWMVTLPDEKGTERLIASYSRIKNLDEAHERVIGVFNDKTESFERLARMDVSLKEPTLAGHPFRASSAGEDYFYFAGRRLFTRIKADLKYLSDPKTYEEFTPLVLGSRYDKETSKLDRGPDGRLIYAWKANTDAVNYKRQKELIAARKMKPEEALWQLRDIDTGEAIVNEAASLFWNDFRQRWVMLVEKDGQVWYAEGDTFVGPWVYAKKIVTHDRYSFYNVTQHPYFDQDGGRLIYFESTYTDAFANPKDVTPRYNYNQIMYRLALDDPRLILPAPVYRAKGANGKASYQLREEVASQNSWQRVEEIPFFAVPPNRKREGLIPIYSTLEHGNLVLRAEPLGGNGAQSQPIFYALPAAGETPASRLTGEWRCKAKSSNGEISFILEMKVNGDEIKGGYAKDNLVITSGRLKGDQVELNLKDERDSYTLTACLIQGKLIGEFKKSGTKEIGTWEGKRANLAWWQMALPAVVPLYEYRHIESGERVYSTEPNLKSNVLKRAAQPICRVWRNPMSLLIVDHMTKIGSSTGKGKH